jgi:DNA-binding SARP family transcriptional activator/streptogramin lyase
VEFRILGPLEVEADDGPVAVGGSRQRAVLALLILHSNRVVSRDLLLDAVWGEQPPESAATALHGAISGLRKTLGAERIQTRAPGYVLSTAPDAVDRSRFEALVDRGREALAAGDAARASADLGAALELWRGTPFADLDAAPFVASERLRLEEARLAAIEERVEADLALGRHAQLVSELQPLVREHALRERLRGQLMLALYRAGRQAEALEVYRQGRHLLAEELGLEPGAALRRLEHAILEQDPALAPRAAEHGPTPRTPRRRLPRPSRRLAAVAAGGVAVVATAVAAGLALTGGGSGAIVVAPDSIAVVDAAANRLVADIAVGHRPVAVAAGEGSVFVANADDRTVSRIDPDSRRTEDVIGLGTDVHDLATGFGALWVAGGDDGTVTRVDLESKTQKVFRFGAGAGQPVLWIATGAGSVWATRGSTLLRIDPETNDYTRVPIAAPAGLAAGSTTVWIPTTDGRLLRVTPHANGISIRTLRAVPGPVAAPAVGLGALWVADYVARGEIQRIDPRTLGISSDDFAATAAVSGTAKTPAVPLDITVGDDAVWAVDGRGTVVRVDPRKLRITATVATAPTLRSSLAAYDGAIWIAMQQPR